MLSKRELKSLLKEYNFRPNKRLGQNFLIDNNMKEKILRNCNLNKEDIVLEVGAGLGALTFDIAECAGEVYAVEKDRVLLKILEDHAREYSNLKVISCDILKFNMNGIFKNRKIKVIGNLPYYITNPIISYLIENRRFVDTVFVTLQKEVGRRLVANPGSKDFSAISVYVQFYSEPHLFFLITRGVFYPQPEVDSVFIRLDMLRKPRVKVRSEEAFFKIVRTAFTKRRKTILNALASGNIFDLEKKDIEYLLKNANINSMKRPEELSLQDFAAITNSIDIP